MKQLGIEPESTVYGEILASMGEGIIFADQDNRIVLVNQAAEQIRGIKAGNFLGRDILEMHSPMARERIGEILAALRSGALPSHTRPLHTKGKVYENIYYPIRADAGAFVGTLMISRDITEKEQLKEENSALREQISAENARGEMVARSAAMQPVFQVIRTTAPLDSTILIGGESGTGKELVARAIHRESRRARHPMVKVNCAALPENLLESELFGYEKGAFTGALRERKGKFEQANGGTIFLDEIGEIPLPAQAKLLRVLQERTVERIGGNREISVDVRIIAATNRDLSLEVAKGRFREDLYYRLNVIPVHLPPLRERREDIIPLTRRFLAIFSEQMGKPALELAPEAARLLLAYNYPGNVRELKNAVERAVALSAGDRITGEDLPPNFTTQSAPAATRLPHPSRMPEGAALAANLNGFEDVLIDQALERAGNNKGEAARLLGVSRKTLWKKLKQRETRVTDR
ncbi:sigma-54 interaction domain-containing protein [Geomesophilobacter sediminis]|uniref:Sigma 54-interacting transcriptional regulator n=1 Tax=Geomesophilobacter sediminis TaxID=2798584 RepID=A0A8J7M0G4_9BACT|nr:sigma 54-interacting transcriptional regulator [Geomesophilobacter sediminis]MBJ6725052.1 sigma 54-interacting transcriptional regulator [Geomesophilobacter sediminis]